MSVAATSDYAIPRYKLRTMLASLASAQAFLGVANAEDASTEAKMPDEIVLEANIKGSRPFILVSQEGVFKITPQSVGHHRPTDRLMKVRMSMNVTGIKLTNSNIEGSIRDKITTLENHLGHIMEDLAALSGIDANLVFGDLSVDQKPTMNPSGDWANDCYCWASFNVEIDPNKGGT